jgi:NAD(P)-dependent dehydrogenase (short-subunit alcohol dehydrogenase family)
MKVAFVTGAAGDIGGAICRTLIAKGAAVAAVDVNEERLQNFALEFPDRKMLMPVHADVTRMDSVVAAVERTRSSLGDVSILVNNAGAITQASLMTTTEQYWLRDIDLNLNGPWRCIHALQEQLLRAQKAVIINIASVNGLQIYGHPGYSVAKAGLIHLTKFCAVEFAKYGVRSVAICPGSVKTHAWEQRRQANPAILEEVASWYPGRDTCTPQDVATLVGAMTDDSMAMVNGAVITLDGGLTAGSDRLASVFAGEKI